MDKVIYKYNRDINYSLNKSNFYAYSFFATEIFNKRNAFKIDLNSIIANISDTIGYNNDEVNELRNYNHKGYYSVDIKFLEGVDERYKDKSLPIINDYKKIDSLSLLKDNKSKALENKKIIDGINNRVNLLKEIMTDDLMKIIDYVDKDEKSLDLTFLNDDNIEANKLKRFYNALVLHKSVINMSNINFEMERQKQRLTSIRNLIPLVDLYMKNRDKFVSSKYNKKDIKVLKNKLSLILNDYIFLLTHQEFSSLKKAYEGIIKKDYSYINEFKYTYKIIIDKIWKYSLTDIDTYSFDFNYLICSKKNKNRLYLMNRNNMSNYESIGYICSYVGNICDVFKIGNNDIFDFKLPIEIKNKFILDTKDNDSINIEAMYVKDNEIVSDDNYIVVEVK